MENITKKILQQQLEILTILKRLDKRRIFTFKWIKEREKEIVACKKRIKEIENLLQKVKDRLNIV